mmetsp:Transcript_697/g.1915  ORF Transcript_697/g.1915 Transcript_697/m.1915 type:complete len:194 (+) Transcript_697:79-660(+)
MALARRLWGLVAGVERDHGATRLRRRPCALPLVPRCAVAIGSAVEAITRRRDFGASQAFGPQRFAEVCGSCSALPSATPRPLLSTLLPVTLLLVSRAFREVAASSSSGAVLPPCGLRELSAGLLWVKNVNVAGKARRKWAQRWRRVRDIFERKEGNYGRPRFWPGEHRDRGNPTQGWDKSGASGADRGLERKF